jgi:hypothetical protein
MCDPVIIGTVARVAMGALVNTGVPLALKAAPLILGGTAAYQAKRAGDKQQAAIKTAADTAQDRYDDQVRATTDRQDVLDTRAADERDRQREREEEQDRLAAEERERARQREEAAEAERQRIRAEQERRERLTREGRQSVTDAFSSTFNPEFYASQRSAYTDLAEGELEDKYSDAAKQLLFAMTRSGLGQSSARNLRQAKLTGAHTRAGEDIQDTASRMVATTKGNVAARKATLMGQAESAQNPTYMGNLAANQAAALAKPQAYEGIGDPFAAALSGLTSAFASETRKRQEEDYRRRMQQYGLTGSGASKVVST